MNTKHQSPAKTAIDHVRALMAALNKDECWTPEQQAVYRAAEEFLVKKGKAS